MSYYCFLCNETHDDNSWTKEHFIPQSMGSPEKQWLRVCSAGNGRSNSVFDNEARDILYWARFERTRRLKRTGEALLRDGTLKQFRFAFDEGSAADERSEFHDIYDRQTDTHIRSDDVYAIAFPVGLMPSERDTLGRGLAKISIGALAYLLKQEGFEDDRMPGILAPLDALRHFALKLEWPRELPALTLRFNRTDVLVRLQRSCANQQTRNHAISLQFHQNAIHLEGMLYSAYGWILDFPNRLGSHPPLRLENQISKSSAPQELCDRTMSRDFICILNPNYTGKPPDLPQHWKRC